MKKVRDKHLQDMADEVYKIVINLDKNNKLSEENIQKIIDYMYEDKDIKKLEFIYYFDIIANSDYQMTDKLYEAIIL